MEEEAPEAAGAPEGGEGPPRERAVAAASAASAVTASSVRHASGLLSARTQAPAAGRGVAHGWQWRESGQVAGVRAGDDGQRLGRTAQVQQVASH